MSLDYVVLIAGIMAISLIALAFWTKMLVYHLFAGGLFLFIGITLHEHTSVLITMLGLTTVQIYLAFFKRI